MAEVSEKDKEMISRTVQLFLLSDIPRSCLAGPCHTPGKSRKAGIIQTFNDTSSF